MIVIQLTADGVVYCQELQQLNAVDRLLSMPQNNADNHHSVTSSSSQPSSSVSKSFVVSGRQSSNSVSYRRTSLIRVLSSAT